MIKWIGIIIVIASLIAWTRLTSGSTQEGNPNGIVNPRLGLIQKRLLVDGVVLPESQVTIKPHISGILEELLVSVGDTVSKGDPIARIKVLPDLITLEQAEAGVVAARINWNREKKSYQRSSVLFDQGIISEDEFERITNSYLIAQLDLESARKREKIILLGNIDGQPGDWNYIRSTLSGVVIELASRAGASVVGRNNFHEGTPIATIADLKVLAFFASIPERDISQVAKGKGIDIVVPAWSNQRVAGIVTQIAPKATSENGLNQFSFRASLELEAGHRHPCGVTGIAEIVLAQAENALLIEESLIDYVNDSSFVELFDPVQGRFVQQLVKTGLSDGIFIQITEGLTPNSQVKTPY